jgi:hypothetical protein
MVGQRVSFMLLAIVLFLGATVRSAHPSDDGIRPPRPQIDDPEYTRAVRFLERIQRHTYLTLGRTPPVYSKELLDRVASEALESSRLTPEQETAFREGLRRIPGRQTSSQYEDPMRYYILESLNDQIREALRAAKVELSGVPVFGTLPTPRVNARTFVVPGSKNVVIVFENEMFLFALLFTKAVLAALPFRGAEEGKVIFSTEREEIQRRIETDDEPRRRFQEALMAYVVAGAPGAAPQYAPRYPYSGENSVLTSLELFVLGHEYGHFMANHLTDGHLVKSGIGNEEVIEIVRSWADEFEADRYGVALSMMAMGRGGQDWARSYWGADFFFTMLDIVERAVNLLATGSDRVAVGFDESRLSHPPPALRRQRLRESMRASFGERAREPIRLGEVLEFSAELLWERTRPRFIEAHKAGQRPHHSWDVGSPARAVAPER